MPDRLLQGERSALESHGAGKVAARNREHRERLEAAGDREALLAEGAAMSADGAVRLATGPASGELPGDVARPVVPVQAAAPLSSGPPSTLTAREREIAALIARGLSNRGIADELVISPATAARHVANIFAKLGFSSRAQVAAWAAQRESGNKG